MIDDIMDFLMAAFLVVGAVLIGTYVGGILAHFLYKLALAGWGVIP